MGRFERWIGVARLDRWSVPPWVLAWWRSRLRPIPIAVAAACALGAGRGNVDSRAPSPEAALAGALGARGLSCDPTDVVWVDGPRGLRGAIAGKAWALARAHTGGRDGADPNDLYLVEARLSPEGAVLEVDGSWNVTETSGADESRPMVRGKLAVYTTAADGLYTGLHVLNLAGRGLLTSDPAYGTFTRVQRAQIALTNLQHTGRTEGVVDDTFVLDPVARRAAFTWRDDGRVALQADDRSIVIDPSSERVISGETFVRVLLDERARPGNLVTWAVDRVRALPWFGDDRMQWIKAVAFTALDGWRARFARDSTAKDVADELGIAEPPPSTQSAPAYRDPEVGFPPPPLKALASPALPGEGQWIALDRDPFITPAPGGLAPAFVTSFVRPDVHRLDVRVYVTLWDPRQIALHIEAGTVEPVGASGEHGPGVVPRAPGVITRLVAGFNGGFQPQHGEYGVQADGIEYLPPKPYAATVVELRDGSNAFGAWPGPAGEVEIPGDIIALRQNLTALVQDGKYNPWGRTWWGGTPPGWPDQIHSTRSAICLTREGFVGYFYSASISAEDLAQGMLAARCTFGIHLDMNPGHAGFEFYNVAQTGRLKPMARPLQADWEAEGKVADMPGYVFRSRRMIRGMGHMLFPRYIQRESRDFFYLTARPVLPGASLAVADAPGADPDEGIWRTRGLPQHGFPYALATTWVHEPEASGLPGSTPPADAGATGARTKLRVLRADPRAMQPATASNVAEPTVLSIAAPPREGAGTTSLWWRDGAFSIGPSAPSADALAVAKGVPASSALAPSSRAVAGVQDEDGMLVWVELPAEEPASEAHTAAMQALLEQLGCSERVSFPGAAHVLLGGSLDIVGAPVASAAPRAPGAPATVAPPIVSRLVRAHTPDAHTIFEDTPIVPIQVWQPLQAKRVRYFYKPTGAPSASSAAPSNPTGSTASK
jgi:hypothetical protein